MCVKQTYAELQKRIISAADNKLPIQFKAGGSKAFYGAATVGEALYIHENQGIVNYHPSELVITVRAGTRLFDIENCLASKQQMLGFEPPRFADTATIGGTIATGLSGPRRAFSGAARDFVLGCKIINGKGEILSFGGEVMKNVAGYDVSRLMVGAMGTLGLILEVSLKVLPQPQTEQTLSFNRDIDQAIATMIQWRNQYLPISAMAYDGNSLLVRMSGTESVIKASIKKLASEHQALNNDIWRDINEQQLPFFQSQENLWRLSVPPATPVMNIPGQWFYDWGGALRWLRTEQSSEQVFDMAQQAGGHALLFRSQGQKFVSQPLNGALKTINDKIKQAFDPFDILNRPAY